MSDTPETDELNGRLDYLLTDAYLLMTQHSRKMERERNTAILDLKFRRELYAYQEQQLSKTIQIRDDLRRELNDTIRVCYVWQDGHTKIGKERDVYKDALQRIYDTASEVDDVWFDIEQISAIAHNALNHHE